VPISVSPQSTRPRSTRPLPWLLAAAAVILVVAGSVIALNRSAKPSVVASTALVRLGPNGRGDAALVKDRGKLRLRVHTSGLDARGGFLEVWVMDPGARRLVSLGPLRSDGIYDLPSGLQPRKFPIVDVSVEPLDGNPAHSTDSVLRGRLRF
jgi:anti-sigma-K factor RskA